MEKDWHAEKKRKVVNDGEESGEESGGEEGGGEEGGGGVEESAEGIGSKTGAEKGKGKEGWCLQVENLRDGPELGLVSTGIGREAWITEAAGQLRARLDELVGGGSDGAVRVGILLLLLREERVVIHEENWRR